MYGMECLNLVGSFKCVDPCKLGFTRNSVTHQCEGIKLTQFITSNFKTTASIEFILLLG